MFDPESSTALRNVRNRVSLFCNFFGVSCMGFRWFQWGVSEAESRYQTGDNIKDGIGKKYNVIGPIGEGGYGSVYKCCDRETKETVAIKRIYLKQEQFADDGIPSLIIREASLLKELDHENIVRLLNVLSGEECVDLVFEHLDYDLSAFMKQYPTLAKNPSVIKRFMHQIFRGLAHCHAHKIIHRDLKPENLLIRCHKLVLKISDFGLARPVGVPATSYSSDLGTLQYVAPEYLVGTGQYSNSTDIWSVGCIFARMIIGDDLFMGFTVHGLLLNVCSVIGHPIQGIFIDDRLRSVLKLKGVPTPQHLQIKFPSFEPAGVDLLSKMLCLDPTERITAADALKHEYFNDIEYVASLPFSCS